MQCSTFFEQQAIPALQKHLQTEVFKQDGTTTYIQLQVKELILFNFDENWVISLVFQMSCLLFTLLYSCYFRLWGFLKGRIKKELLHYRSRKPALFRGASEALIRPLNRFFVTLLLINYKTDDHETQHRGRYHC